MSPSAVAMPKSVSTTRSPVSMTLAGFTSRCSTAAWWAVRSAASRCWPIAATDCAGSVPTWESNW